MSCAGMAMLRLGFSSGGGSRWGEEERRRGATDNDDVGRRGTEMREVQTARQAGERAGECLCAQTSDGWPGEGAGRGSMRPRQRQKAHQLSDNEKKRAPVFCRGVRVAGARPGRAWRRYGREWAVPGNRPTEINAGCGEGSVSGAQARNKQPHDEHRTAPALAPLNMRLAPSTAPCGRYLPRKKEARWRLAAGNRVVVGAARRAAPPHLAASQLRFGAHNPSGGQRVVFS